MTIRISDGARAMGLQIVDRGPDDGARLVEVFTTYYGSWEVSDSVYSVPKWARDKYLKPPWDPMYNDDGGADTHCFALLIDEDGNPIPFTQILASYDNWRTTIEKPGKKHGWANVYTPNGFVGAGNGPWQWMPKGAGECLKGGGLPANHHVSSWGVWQLGRRKPIPPDPPPPDDKCETDMLKIGQWADDAKETMIQAIEIVERISSVAKGED